MSHYDSCRDDEYKEEEPQTRPTLRKVRLASINGKQLTI